MNTITANSARASTKPSARSAPPPSTGLLAPARAQHPLRGRCGSQPGSLLKTRIPIRTGTWDVTGPGYLEADSVAHCGASLAGDFIWSLTCTDIVEVWGPRMNFFLPGLKLKQKWRDRSQWKKRYEPARTAYERLLDRGVLGPKARRQLRERYEGLDSFVLKAELERRLKPILAAAEVLPRPAGGYAAR